MIAMQTELSRRQWLGGAAAGAVAGLTAGAASAVQDAPAQDHFVYCLNTSTIRGQNLSITEEVNIASRAGFQAIEPWISELEQYVQRGGSLRDLARRIRDAGLQVADAIGFSEWLVDDEARRGRGLENLRRAMDLVQQIGGRRIAAPPAGVTNQADLPLARVTERYRAILELGQRMGVVPQLELWGFSRVLSRLGECAQVTIDTGHVQACILADVFHLYKGGSPFGGVRLLSSSALQIIHMNDYPARPPRAEITDAQRVYPGDGVAPIGQLIRDLRHIGFRGALSLELFNRDVWRQDALAVARVGLEKMRAVVRQSLTP
jgi:sugar phosphate isomerase/epimerase